MLDTVWREEETKNNILILVGKSLSASIRLKDLEAGRSDEIGNLNDSSLNIDPISNCVMVNFGQNYKNVHPAPLRIKANSITDEWVLTYF